MGDDPAFGVHGEEMNGNLLVAVDSVVVPDLLLKLSWCMQLRRLRGPIGSPPMRIWLPLLVDHCPAAISACFVVIFLDVKGLDSRRLCSRLLGMMDPPLFGVNGEDREIISPVDSVALDLLKLSWVLSSSSITIVG